MRCRCCHLHSIFVVLLLSALIPAKSFRIRNVFRDTCNIKGFKYYQAKHRYQNKQSKTFSESISTRLHSSPSDEIDLKTLFREPPSESELAASALDHPGLDALKIDRRNNVTIKLSEVKQIWLKKVGSSKKAPKFNLEDSVSLIQREDSHIIIVDDKSEDGDRKDGDDEDEEVYVTEDELRRLWGKASTEPMGKPLGSFDLKEALLLLEDSEFDVEDSAEKIDREETVDTVDGEELYISQTELERIWEDRGKIKWGMPAKDFDEKLALLFLDDDEDDDGEGIEYVSTLDINLSSDEPDFWMKRHPESPRIGEILTSIHAELEDSSRNRPAWKKERQILTPDIDTQVFMGDIMMSNTFMTQRIPANWNDPELEGMSEAYISTGTMAWPGEAETDYTKQPKIWERLNLPIGPSYDKKVSSSTGSLAASLDQGELVQTAKAEEKIDWETFDFASQPDIYAGTGLKELDGLASDKTGLSDNNLDDAEDDLDIDSFFERLDSGTKLPRQNKRDGSSAIGENPLEDGLLASEIGSVAGKMDDGEEEEDEEDEDDLDSSSEGAQVLNVVSSGSNAVYVKQQVAPTSKDWVTPRSWLRKAEFKQHVGIEEWGLYGEGIQYNSSSSTITVFGKDVTSSSISLSELSRRLREKSGLLEAQESLPSTSTARSNANAALEPLERTEREILAAGSGVRLNEDEDIWAEQTWTDDDRYTAEAIAHVMKVTDLYLTDHCKLSQRRMESESSHRLLASRLLEDHNLFREQVPAYLIPDANRGVEYTDEIIEMKGKIILEAKTDDPEIAYANDTFTHNEELDVINKVGTIREQYDWKPRSGHDETTFEIDQKIVERIVPLLEYANYVVELKSTKDNVLVFDYRGSMRHVVGIRSVMINIAKECFPELVELRLETSRARDNFDI